MRVVLKINDDERQILDSLLYAEQRKFYSKSGSSEYGLFGNMSHFGWNRVGGKLTVDINKMTCTIEMVRSAYKQVETDVLGGWQGLRYLEVLEYDTTEPNWYWFNDYYSQKALACEILYNDVFRDMPVHEIIMRDGQGLAYYTKIKSSFDNVMLKLHLDKYSRSNEDLFNAIELYIVNYEAYCLGVEHDASEHVEDIRLRMEHFPNYRSGGY